MRAIFALGAACVLLTGPAHATADAPDTAEGWALMQIEAAQDRTQDHSSDIWRGRHHYLYDENNPAGPATVGASPSDARACANERVRVHRSDGSTVVRRLNRCK